MRGRARARVLRRDCPFRTATVDFVFATTSAAVLSAEDSGGCQKAADGGRPSGAAVRGHRLSVGPVPHVRARASVRPGLPSS